MLVVHFYLGFFISLLYSLLDNEVSCKPNPSIRALKDDLAVEQRLLGWDTEILDLKEIPTEQLYWSNVQSEVKFYLYTRMNDDTYQELFFGNATSIKGSYINFDYPTTIIVHGYLDSISSDVIQLIKKNLLLREEINVIGVDWSSITDTLIYTNAVDDVPSVGQYLSQFLIFLFNQGQNINKLHLIGHSLGAHVVGLAGRNLIQSNIGKIPRITGLDPAKPGFDGVGVSGRLDATDADFVDCIHTCSGELGLEKAICAVDFYPNGATDDQPGCPWWDLVGICSHGRSYEYYAESIILTHRFQAKKCQTIPQDDNSGGCIFSLALMGDPATPQYKGYYLVITNDAYPYAQDIINNT